MFEREHHRRIQSVLDSLDADFLAGHGCYFGGGTAIALAWGEYRESVDVDFVVAGVDGYRAIRERVSGKDGIRALGRPGSLLVPARELRTDQYGIRTLVDVQGTLIKLEIVREARIEFAAPGEHDRVCGVVRLTDLDLATTKLLANSDRWADDAVNSRDVIDLAMMNLPRATLRAATTKATRAYATVERDLLRAIEALATRRGRLEQCMTALQMTTTPRALLWKRIKRLSEPAHPAGGS